MITEHMMRLGGGSLKLSPSAPVEVTNSILALVDEDAGGPGAEIVFTTARVSPTDVDDAAILASATFAGELLKRTNRFTLEFDGLGYWLDTYPETTISFSSASVATVLSSVLTNGLTVGTVAGGGTVSRSFPAYSATRREILDACATSGGWEYRINANGTVDAGTSVFVSPPEVIVKKKAGSVNGSHRGIDGGILNQSVDVSSLSTKVVALTAGEGASIAAGSASQTLAKKTRTGGTPALVTVLDAPSEQSTNAVASATNYLNLRSLRRKIEVSSTSHDLPLHARPGDEIFIYNLPESLVDPSNQVEDDGDTISPVQVRLISYTRPIEKGGSVLIRPNSASPAYIDVTPWVAWETGDTFWTVGTWVPHFGPVNRSHPEIEDRITP